MRLVLHPKVHSDVQAIMEYYERVASPELADDFYSELRHFLLEAAARPEMELKQSFVVQPRSGPRKLGPSFGNGWPD